jgi:hypothetical protein
MECTADLPEGPVDWQFGLNFCAEAVAALCISTGRSREEIIEYFGDYLGCYAPDAIANLLSEWRHTLLGLAGVPCPVCGRKHAPMPAGHLTGGDK